MDAAADLPGVAGGEDLLLGAVVGWVLPWVADAEDLPWAAVVD